MIAWRQRYCLHAWLVLSVRNMHLLLSRGKACKPRWRGPSDVLLALTNSTLHPAALCPAPLQAHQPWSPTSATLRSISLRRMSSSAGRMSSLLSACLPTTLMAMLLMKDDSTPRFLGSAAPGGGAGGQG